jgi:DNA (cytosine-5)-methyltransferase 1
MTTALSPDSWVTTPAGLLAPPIPTTRYDRPVGIDLFAGAGGFSTGCHMAGLHMAAAVEAWPEAALTYLVNLARPGVKIHYDTPEREAKFTKILERHLGVTTKGKTKLVPGGSLAGDGWISHRPFWERSCEHFWLADIRNITGQQILDALGLRRGEVTAVVGGPPCQGFSAAGKRNVMDPRNSLVFEFCRLVLEIRPKTFVMENVPAMATMLTPEGVPVIDAIARVMSDGGFSEYDALKSTLRAQSGTAGAMRRDKPRPRRKAQAEPEPQEPAMDALW